MTYARARLWLGISGVGTLVLAATFFLTTRAHEAFLPISTAWHPDDVWSLTAFVGVFLLIMIPFDLLGGFILPYRFRRQEKNFGSFFGSWLVGTMLQSASFVATGLAILAVGRMSGVIGVVVLIAVLSVGYVALQGVLMRWTTRGVLNNHREKLTSLERQLAEWGLESGPIVIVNHADPGFTGGIVGLPGQETIVIPLSWMQKLSLGQTAAAIARRVIAVRSGSRTTGLLLALLWILLGFSMAANFPGAGVDSVVQLITTCCGFTLWTFIGLLTLPTISRRASYAIDSRVVRCGVPAPLLEETLISLDRLQDDEPERSKLVEAIFHPVPSVTNRRNETRQTRIGAWHAARMVLFLSWSCLGLLSRAVHCNAGRPELWVMPPTD